MDIDIHKLCSTGLKDLGRLLHALDHVRLAILKIVCSRNADPHPCDAVSQCRKKVIDRHILRLYVIGIVSSDGRKSPRDVGDVARQHTNRIGVDCKPQGIGIGNASHSRSNARDAAQRGRATDRSPGVRTESDAAHSRRQCGGCAATGPTWNAGDVPRIDAVPVVDVVGRRAVAEFRQIGFSQEHRAGSPDPPYDLGIRIGNVVAENTGTVSGPHAGNLKAIFHRHRYAVKQA